MTNHATCVFAVCPRDRAPALDGLPGYAEAAGPVRPLHAGRLTAIAQPVPLDVFGPEELPRRLADPATLEAFARAHHGVVAAVAAAAPTVPLPLVTLYRGEGRAREAISADGSRLLAVLARVGDRREWGVKVSVTGPATTAPPEPSAPPTPASGHAYLERVRGRQRAREQLQRAALDAAERVHAALCPIAAAARRLRLRDAEVLNAAYLVDARHTPELTARVAALRRDPGLAEGVRVEVTGPWAPYSFAGTEAAP
jgi:hypothetical protein